MLSFFDTDLTFGRSLIAVFGRTSDGATIGVDVVVWVAGADVVVKVDRRGLPSFDTGVVPVAVCFGLPKSQFK